MLMGDLLENKVTTKNYEIFLAIDFLRIFISILRKNKIMFYSKQLLNTIGRNYQEFKDLFLDIDIRENYGVFFSQDIEEAITMLQILGEVIKVNLRYDKIIIKLSEVSADDIIKNCDSQILKRMNKFTDIFLSENYS